MITHLKKKKLSTCSPLSPLTRPVLEKRSAIQNCSIRALHKLMRQMSAIMENQPTPPIIRIKRRPAIRRQLRIQSVQPVIVPCSPICDVPRKLGVVQSTRVYGAVENRGSAFVGMDVAGNDEIDRILIQRSFERFLTFCADNAAHVPRPMTS